jgi:hypothetical protein
MVVEKALSVIEGRWRDVVRRVVQQRALPGDDSFGDLMIFVAFMAVRVLRIREILSEFVDRVSKAELFAVMAIEANRTRFRNAIEAHGGKMTIPEKPDIVEQRRHLIQAHPKHGLRWSDVVRGAEIGNIGGVVRDFR